MRIGRSKRSFLSSFGAALFTAVFCMYAVSPLYFSFSLDAAGKSTFDASEDGAVSRGLVLVQVLSSSFGSDNAAGQQDINAATDDDDNDGMVLARKKRALAQSKELIERPVSISIAGAVPVKCDTQLWKSRESRTPALQVHANNGFHHIHSGISPPPHSVRMFTC